LCFQIKHHRENECELFQELKSDFESLPEKSLAHETIFTLRCLLLKENKNVDWWENVIQKLEHHTEIRHSKSVCLEHDRKVCANLKPIYGANEKFFSESEIIRVCGVINVNAFSAVKLENECGSRRVKRKLT